MVPRCNTCKHMAQNSDGTIFCLLLKVIPEKVCKFHQFDEKDRTCVSCADMKLAESDDGDPVLYCTTFRRSATVMEYDYCSRFRRC